MQAAAAMSARFGLATSSEPSETSPVLDTAHNDDPFSKSKDAEVSVSLAILPRLIKWYFSALRPVFLEYRFLI